MSFFGSFLFALGISLTGCRTPCSEERFARPFDANKVAQLSHDAFKVAYHVKFLAQQDLTQSADHPQHFATTRIPRPNFGLNSRPRGVSDSGLDSQLDWEVLNCLELLSWRVAWIPRDIQKNPATTRCSSKKSFENAATYAKLIKADFRPTSFQPATAGQIEDLLQMFDQISSFYEVKR